MPPAFGFLSVAVGKIDVLWGKHSMPADWWESEKEFMGRRESSIKFHGKSSREDEGKQVCKRGEGENSPINCYLSFIINISIYQKI